MKNAVLRITGMLSFLAGIVLFIQPSLTGFVIANDVSNLGDFLGLLLVLVGIVLVGMAKTPDLVERTDSGMRVVTTNHFLRQIKRFPIEPINEAVKKIGTGKGSEEKLRKNRGYAVAVGGGKRIRFYRSGNEVQLDSYLTQHEYQQL